MSANSMNIRQFQVADPVSGQSVTAVCVTCGNDLVVVVGGGERYHIGAAALSISMPRIKDPEILTNSTYLVPVPGHKEEDLARNGSLKLSKGLAKNVVMTVGIHQDQISKAGIQNFLALFDDLVEKILKDFQEKG
jgi:hypothetical protein